MLKFILVCVFWVPVSSLALSFPDRFDAEIKSASKLYLPFVDWRLYKAQLYQESRLDPLAVSPVGAAGVAQFMPGTWRDIGRRVGAGDASPFVAEVAIDAGAYYMRYLRLQWRAPRPESDRHSLAMASYNAGLGNLLKAQRRCGGVALYAEVVACLPDVTGKHSKETITYVDRIWRYFVAILVGL